MHYTTRKFCCICGSQKMIQKITIENFPLYMGVTSEEESSDKFFNQTWVECVECGCLQLLNLLPLNEIYQHNHSTEVVGQIWKEHHDLFAEFISLNSPRKILEIGGAHGYLATSLVTKLPGVEYTIVEPDSNLIDPRIKIIKGYIEENSQELKNKDCIIHSHVLEHIYDPVSFINTISESVNFGANMFISFPNMSGLIESGSLNSLNFEHTYLLNPLHAEIIFQQSGFSIISKKEYLSHSFFYHLSKEKVKSNSKVHYPNIKWQSLEFEKLVNSLRDFVTKLNEIILNYPDPVYLFGAHVFSQSFMALGLNPDRINGILDNSTGKQNKRLYGTSLMVLEPSVISQINQPMVILNASHYQSEIKSQLMSINPDVRIIEISGDY
jgi:2-polyprenyl-3-methyl-5-hydroxy-6-metoxy-1,4-benzoquinol methylase